MNATNNTLDVEPLEPVTSDDEFLYHAAMAMTHVKFVRTFARIEQGQPCESCGAIWEVQPHTDVKELIHRDDCVYNRCCVLADEEMVY